MHIAYWTFIVTLSCFWIIIIPMNLIDSLKYWIDGWIIDRIKEIFTSLIYIMCAKIRHKEIRQTSAIPEN